MRQYRFKGVLSTLTGNRPGSAQTPDWRPEMLAGDTCTHSAQLRAELAPCRFGDARGPLFPYRATTAYVQKVGKHFMSAEVISRLAEIRTGLAAGHDLTSAYIDCVLDKNDNRYRYETYLALPLLKPLMHSHTKYLPAPPLTAFLVADAMRFELRALHGWHELMPVTRPSLDIVRKRLRKGVRFAAPWCPSYEHPRFQGHGLDYLLELAERPEQPEPARLLLAALPAAADQDAALRIAVSVLPVDVRHDEYLFIRILQASETNFVTLADHLQTAIQGIQSRDAERTQAAVTAAGHCMVQGSRLFSILATMNAGSFQRFRQFTEGASAIQSEHYKRFELLCGVPSAQRLASAAFSNVPPVQDEARGDPETLTRVYLNARSQGWFGAAEWESIDAALDQLEATHQRWKTTHFRIASKMLGDARGSGYTAGVPYLQELLDNRLFWAIPGRAARNHRGE
jgi:tryptophan 2,3-dioxygenase